MPTRLVVSCQSKFAALRMSGSKFARHEVDLVRIRFPEVLIRVEQGPVWI